MKLSRIGEFALINRISKIIGKPSINIVKGIGDDAAVIKPSKNKLLVITTDTLIEDIHFSFDYFSFYDLGWKSLAASLSDIASMGAIPTAAVVSIGIPSKIEVRDIDGFYKGMKKLADKYKVSIAGGDTVSSPDKVYISVTLLGEVSKKNLLLRRGAKPGDLIMVTGDLGGAAPGKKTKHLRPEPRLKESRIIAKCGATSMIDSSDGLSRSLNEICASSRTGSVIFEKKLPAAKGASLTEVLHGGEDYELVFTCPSGRAGEIIRKLKGLAKASVIGIVTKNKNKMVIAGLDGKERKLETKGFEHF